MPYLFTQTNTTPTAEQRRDFLQAASNEIAQALGKPESYVMVALRQGTEMLFGGDDAPLAYVELKSIGLPRDRTKALSTTICDLINNHLSIPPARVYIEFADAERGLWGTNGTTFER